MPALMGGVITMMSGGHGASGGAASGFFAGFSLLIGTQMVVFACGFLLWLRERKLQVSGISATPA